jgi:hypothetical protein
MIQRFISSLYDFLTFGVMLWIFQAAPELFRAGWFIESLATQTLVIFVIRTAGNPFKSRPSRPLLASVFAGVIAGLVVVVSPLGGLLGFAALPPLFFGVGAHDRDLPGSGAAAQASLLEHYRCTDAARCTSDDRCWRSGRRSRLRVGTCGQQFGA